MAEYEYMYGRSGKWEAGNEVISDKILFYAE
jgi:hypothetical protein